MTPTDRHGAPEASARFATGGTRLARALRRAARVPDGARLRRDPVPWCAATALIALSIALVRPIGAAPGVVSDLDCVVEPSLVVDVSAAVPGLLASVRHERGDWVEAGTAMARLEARVEAATVAIAETAAADTSAIELRRLTAEFGRRTRERNRELAEAVSSQALDQIETEAGIAQLQVVQERRALALAELEAVRARALLDQRTVRSPIDGAVVARLVDAGEFVDGEPIYRVARLDPLHVEVIVPIEWLDAVGPGMAATVTLQAPGYETRPLAATVDRVDAVADAASATYGVRLALENPTLEIPSGVRCRVDFLAS